MSNPAATGFGLNPQDELNDLRMSEKAMPLLEHVKKFCAEVVAPMAEKFDAMGEGRADRWSYVPGQLEQEREERGMLATRLTALLGERDLAVASLGWWSRRRYQRR